MATSEVSICNDALILIGGTRISSLAEDTKQGQLCNEQYSKVRDQLLNSHPWNFALYRKELSAEPELPTGWYDWTYAYTIPADVLRILDLDDTEASWAKENTYIFTNYSPVSIRYIKKITETGRFPPHFDKALAHALALNIIYALTQSSTLVAGFKDIADLAIREARSFDSQEGGVRSINTSDYLRSRL